MLRLAKKWAALARALLTASAAFPKPAAAQGRPHGERLLNIVRDAFEDLGFVFKTGGRALSSVYEGIRLPTGDEILNFHGGEQAVRKMLAEWGLSEKVFNDVIAWFSTDRPLDRSYDLIFTIAGRKMDFLVEIKSVNDFESNIAHTVYEALYDSYLAAKGDAVVWVTQGCPGKAWAQRLLDYIRWHKVGVSTSLSDVAFIARAVEAAALSAYGISLGDIFEWKWIR
jgi:hypothetical protein